MHEVFCLPLFFHGRFGSRWRGGKILLQLVVLQEADGPLIQPLPELGAGVPDRFFGVVDDVTRLSVEPVMQTAELIAREIEDRLGVAAHKRLPELPRAGMVRSASCCPSRNSPYVGKPSISSIRSPISQSNSHEAITS